MNSETDRDQSKHSRLTQSVFMYIATCLKDGDERAMERLRLRSDQTERLAKMPAADFLRLSEIAQECVTFDIDPESLDLAFHQIDRRRHRDELIQHCIRQDAPRDMMRAFFGLSRHRYTQMRSTSGLPAAIGRHPRPAAAIERRIHESWHENGGHWSPESLLEISEKLDISLRAIWDQLKHNA